jgi:preprotein translocase subunit SecG
MPSEAKWGISFLAGAALLAIGWKIYFVLVALHILICLVLISVILLQSGEAADLAGAFGGSGSQTAFGPRGAATFLSRATTWCAVMFMFTSLALTSHVQTATGGGHSVLEQFSKSAPAPKSAPAQPGAPALPATPVQQPQPAAPTQSTQPALPSAPPAQTPPAPATK